MILVAAVCAVLFDEHFVFGGIDDHDSQGQLPGQALGSDGQASSCGTLRLDHRNVQRRQTEKQKQKQKQARSIAELFVSAKSHLAVCLSFLGGDAEADKNLFGNSRSEF
eukprot:4514598-Amphidinium_carterae.1